MNVGIILHPIDLQKVRSDCRYFYPIMGRVLDPVLKRMDDYSLKNLIGRLAPHKFMNVRVSNELRIVGFMVPMFPIDMARDRKKALRNIQKTFEIARDLEVDIVTLAAFTSIVSNGGEDLSTTYSVAYTSGNALTAALCIDGIEKAVELFRKDLLSSRVAIIGATGDIGSVCARYFAGKCSHLVLCSRSISESSKLYQSIASESPVNLQAINDVGEAVKEADVILSVASSFGSTFDCANLKSGALICDAGMPPNFAQNLNRDDVFVFDGGKAAVNFYDRIQNHAWKALFPNNSLFGCFSEAIVLALADQVQNFSTGKGSLTLDKLNLIRSIAKEQGVRLADFSYRGKLYDQSEIENMAPRVGG